MAILTGSFGTQIRGNEFVSEDKKHVGAPNTKGEKYGIMNI
jgi:hypothetical protein